jgi:hypothetical protein
MRLTNIFRAALGVVAVLLACLSLMEFIGVVCSQGARRGRRFEV